MCSARFKCVNYLSGVPNSCGLLADCTAVDEVQGKDSAFLLRPGNGLRNRPAVPLHCDELADNF